MSAATPLHWIGFGVIVTALLAIDLGVFHRKPHAISFREAAGWSVFWISLALAFNAFVWWRFGPVAGQEFLAGYLIEQSLSVDNVFVFLILFSTFAVPPELQHRLLFWGVAGAVVMRGLFVFAGVAAIEAFHGVLYLFAAILFYTGFKMLRAGEQEAHPEKNPLFRLFQRMVPSTPQWRGPAFFVRENGKLLATPMLTVLVLVELTDLMFAVDSIPAIFAVTRDPFIVLTSNVFAILGLRSLTFCLSGLLDRLAYLRPALAVVLLFIATKMAIAEWVHIPIGISLAVVAGVLGAGVVISLLRAPKHVDHAELTAPDPPAPASNKDARSA